MKKDAKCMCVCVYVCCSMLLMRKWKSRFLPPQTVYILHILIDHISLPPSLPPSLHRYDQVLVEGLPDWKQPLFYYRRMRKMGLVELMVMLLAMASVAHYIYGWAVFAEKQIVLVIRYR